MVSLSDCAGFGPGLPSRVLIFAAPSSTPADTGDPDGDATWNA